MFTAEQKRYVYENSVKVNDNNKYIEIMGYYSEYFSKAKIATIKRKVGFIIILLFAVYLACQHFIFHPLEIRTLIFRGAAIFVVSLVVLKLGTIITNYIDDMPTIKRIKNKECDMLYFEGDLNDVRKFINYKSASSAIYDYFMVVSGNKFDISKELYKTLLPNKGKKIRIYYFAELLTRQMYISDASVVMIED